MIYMYIHDYAQHHDLTSHNIHFRTHSIVYISIYQCYNTDMKRPTAPQTNASETPELWLTYWQRLEKYEEYERNQSRKEYRRLYYLERTKQRQIHKMYQLINKYPNEAKKHITQ